MKDINTMADKIRFAQETLNVINGKWKVPILMAMHSGISRFRDLQRSVPGITTRVLSKELKDLESSELILRVVHEGRPVSIEYKLTTHSFSLTPVVDEMIKWGKKHSKGGL